MANGLTTQFSYYGYGFWIAFLSGAETWQFSHSDMI